MGHHEDSTTYRGIEAILSYPFQQQGQKPAKLNGKIRGREHTNHGPSLPRPFYSRLRGIRDIISRCHGSINGSPQMGWFTTKNDQNLMSKLRNKWDSKPNLRIESDKKCHVTTEKRA